MCEEFGIIFYFYFQNDACVDGNWKFAKINKENVKG